MEKGRKSNREIASLLGKAPQTIHTEIKRGTVRQCLGKGCFKEIYSADYAQQAYENNRKRSVKKSSVTKELILFENLFKPRQLHLAVRMVTDFVSFICNLKAVL